MKILSLLGKVKEDLEKHFMVPVTFTLKEDKQNIRFSEVHISLHGESVSFFGTFDLLLKEADKVKADYQKCNRVVDYLIEYFIKEIKKDNELDALNEVVNNLRYLYESNVYGIHHKVDDTALAKAIFIFIDQKEEKHMVCLDAAQLKKEYEDRFKTEAAADVLVDLSKFSTLLNEEKVEEAKNFLNGLKRNFVTPSKEEAKQIYATLVNVPCVHLCGK